MPIEELLALYGYEASDPISEHDSESNDITPNLPDMTLDKVRAALCLVSAHGVEVLPISEGLEGACLVLGKTRCRNTSVKCLGEKGQRISVSKSMELWFQVFVHRWGCVKSQGKFISSLCSSSSL